MKRSKRFAVLAQRPVNQDGLIGEWPEEGLIAMDSPFDPVSSVKVDNGLIVELDGKRRDQFDMIDRFIADYAINVERTEQAMRLEAVEIARLPYYILHGWRYIAFGPDDKLYVAVGADCNPKFPIS